MKVRVVKKLPRGYIGLNKPAAKERKLPFPYPADTVVVLRSLSPANKKKVAAHEKIEAFHMNRGLKYRVAHKIAEALTKRRRK